MYVIFKRTTKYSGRIVAGLDSDSVRLWDGQLVQTCLADAICEVKAFCPSLNLWVRLMHLHPLGSSQSSLAVKFAGVEKSRRIEFSLGRWAPTDPKLKAFGPPSLNLWVRLMHPPLVKTYLGQQNQTYLSVSKYICPKCKCICPNLLTLDQCSALVECYALILAKRNQVNLSKLSNRMFSV